LFGKSVYGYKCPLCKTVSPESVNYCVKCGHWLLDTNHPGKRVKANVSIVRGLKLFFGGVMVGIIALIVIALTTNGGAKTKSASNIASNQLPSQQQWVKTNSWEGVGTKTTEKFPVSGKDWRITWKTLEAKNNSGVLHLYVYGSNGQPISVAANVQGNAGDTTYVHKGPGDFYLNINSANLKWQITVEQLK
jgi:hypothetical protein